MLLALISWRNLSTRRTPSRMRSLLPRLACSADQPRVQSTKGVEAHDVRVGLGAIGAVLLCSGARGTGGVAVTSALSSGSIRQRQEVGRTLSCERDKCHTIVSISALQCGHPRYSSTHSVGRPQPLARGQVGGGRRRLVVLVVHCVRVQVRAASVWSCGGGMAFGYCFHLTDS